MYIAIFSLLAVAVFLYGQQYALHSFSATFKTGAKTLGAVSSNNKSTRLIVLAVLAGCLVAVNALFRRKA